MTTDRPPITNWAGNLAYRARRILQPRSIDELQGMVAASPGFRPSGTRHSFTDIGDTDGELVSLARLPRRFELDEDAGTVTIDGGATYAAVGEALHARGLALENLPSLPHITVAGSCATGTHGSGDRSGVLATAVLALDLVLADGTLARAERGGDIPLEAAAVSLGALGVVSALTLRVHPARDIRQNVYEQLPLAAFDEAFEAAHELADSASFFATWRDEAIDQVWLKQAMGGDMGALPSRFFGATAAAADVHPIRGMPPENTTPQLGQPGPWHERLPHFRASHMPSSGAELQSEFFVSRGDVGRAYRALLGIRDTLAPLVQVSEIRTMAADDLWLSPAHGRASAAFHFTWVDDWARVLAVLPAVERALEPFEPRAHWAKLSLRGPRDARGRFERLGDFVALADRLDPGRKLRNSYLDALLEP